MTRERGPASIPIGCAHWLLIECSNGSLDAYLGLRDLLRSGGLSGDVKVSEASLAEQLGMSRAPVREALRVLDAQGLVVGRGRGVRVRVPGARELEETFETRCALESYAAQTAAEAQRAGLLLPARLREVEQLALRCDEATRARGPEAGTMANRRFHIAMAALAGNSQIDELLATVWDQITIATRAGLTVEPGISAVHQEHREVLNAIRDGSPEKARAAVARHIDQTRQAAQHDGEAVKELM